MEGQHLDWISYAMDDLAWSSSAIQEGIWSRACFATQQAVEKALKGFLLHQGRTVPHSHNLPNLLYECSELDPSFDRFREACNTLTDYYFTTRYPDVRPLIDQTEATAREALLMATEVVRFVEERVRGPRAGLG